MQAPQIVYNDALTTGGYHNKDIEKTVDRLIQGNTYKDSSTILIIPTRGEIHGKVVQTWMSMMTPMNQKFVRSFIFNMEVADAYNAAIADIISHPEMSKWKYILTMEEDNMPPADGLIKLYESMDQYDVVGGLYYTKGESGQPMIYGNPYVSPMTFMPQLPVPEFVQPACGLGMGFTLYKMSIFKDERVPRPWFKTQQEFVQEGLRCYSQDLYFFENIYKLGYKIACDTRVKVGHYEKERDIIW